MAPFTRAQVQAFDRRAAEAYALPTLLLMENAAAAAAEVLRSRYQHGTVAILCGKGNNGGDGLALARRLDAARVPVQVLLLASPEQLTADARANLRMVQAAELPLEILPAGLPREQLAQRLAPAAWLVDALLGVGAQGDPREPLAGAIAAMNSAPGKRFALDLPSGLDCDTGQPAAPTVRAEVTCTFVAPKLGFANPAAQPYLGQVVVVGLGAPRKLLREFEAE